MRLPWWARENPLISPVELDVVLAQDRLKVLLVKMEQGLWVVDGRILIQVAQLILEQVFILVKFRLLPNAVIDLRAQNEGVKLSTLLVLYRLHELSREHAHVLQVL